VIERIPLDHYNTPHRNIQILSHYERQYSLSIKSSVTINFVEEARGGPFVYHDGFRDGCERAAKLGFDGVEIFAPGPDAISVAEVKSITGDLGLDVAAVGTGAGMILHGHSFSNRDDSAREQAIDFAKSMVDFGAEFSAPAIVGSMQGSADSADERIEAIRRLTESMQELGSHAETQGLRLLFEPINRYESNLINTVGAAADLINNQSSTSIRVMADLFHMNIEEVDVSASIKGTGSLVGHVHFADSNRSAVGMGHTDMAPIAQALKDIHFDGYLSAEIFPKPDSDAAAKQTIESFRKYFV
jgi:sugar phosphate isomerase/epimerase